MTANDITEPAPKTREELQIEDCRTQDFSQQGLPAPLAKNVRYIASLMTTRDPEVYSKEQIADAAIKQKMKQLNLARDQLTPLRMVIAKVNTRKDMIWVYFIDDATDNIGGEE